MYWGPKFTDYTPVENKKSIVTTSWLALYFLRYFPVSTSLTHILEANGENVTFYSIIPGETESYAEALTIKAIVNPGTSGEIFFEAGYTIDDYITLYVFSPLKHHDKIIVKSIAYMVIKTKNLRRIFASFVGLLV
jgi:hypothetical protein